MIKTVFESEHRQLVIVTRQELENDNDHTYITKIDDKYHAHAITRPLAMTNHCKAIQSILY